MALSSSVIVSGIQYTAESLLGFPAGNPLPGPFTYNLRLSNNHRRQSLHCARILGMAGPQTTHSATSANTATSTGAAPHFCSLRNSIHPIFRRSNFDHGIDHETLLPAVQLASRLMSRPTPLSIWHSIFFSELCRIKHVIHPRDERHFEFTEFSENLSEEQVRKTEAALIDLADKIRFTAFEVPQCENWGLEALMGDGNTAIIRISTKKIAELQSAATKYAQGNTDDIEYVLRSFLLAKDLVHELTHAACHIRDNANFYFPMSAIAEEGYEWEAQVFVGLIHLETIPPHMANPRKSFQAFITPWPNLRHIGLYLLNNHRIGIRLRHAAVLLDGAGTWATRAMLAATSALIL